MRAASARPHQAEACRGNSPAGHRSREEAFVEAALVCSRQARQEGFRVVRRFLVGTFVQVDPKHPCQAKRCQKGFRRVHCFLAVSIRSLAGQVCLPVQQLALP